MAQTALILVKGTKLAQKSAAPSYKGSVELDAEPDANCCLQPAALPPAAAALIFSQSSSTSPGEMTAPPPAFTWLLIF